MHIRHLRFPEASNFFGTIKIGNFQGLWLGWIILFPKSAEFKYLFPFDIVQEFYNSVK